MRAFLAVACAGLSLVIGTACLAATIEPVQGDLLVNRGQGFDHVSGRTEANVGDLVMVSTQGPANLSYPDGCKISAAPGTVMTISAMSPCASEARAQLALPHGVSRLPNGDIVIDPKITIKGNIKSSADGDKYQRGGETLKSSDAQIAREREHAKAYDGETEYTADYTIVKKPNGDIDTSKSTVTFKTVYYSNNGEKTDSGWQTEPIPITGATFNPDGSVASFKFSGGDWYPPTNGLINKGLSGSIDLNTGKVEVTASYQSKANGVIDTYKFAGKVETPKKPEKPAPKPPVANNPVPPPPNPVPPVLGGALAVGASLTFFDIFVDLTPAKPVSP